MYTDAQQQQIIDHTLKHASPTTQLEQWVAETEHSARQQPKGALKPPKKIRHPLGTLYHRWIIRQIQPQQQQQLK
jgi:hypothetical protein